MGLAMRGASEDFDAVRLMGIKANRVIAVAFGPAGAEKLVPSAVSYPVASRLSGTAPVMSEPGAARSTSCPAVEKGATWSFSSVAATVSTCGHAAG